MDDPRPVADRPRLTTRLRRLALAATIFVTHVPAAAASEVEPLSLVDLIADSDRILRGTVTRVTEGRSGDDVPFTEVTLRVAERILGAGTDEYAFRQIGRDGQGGLPAWTPGERVILFLERPAATGLQTTVGRGQGKLRLLGGEVSASPGLDALFADVVVDASGLSLDQVAMLEGGTDAVGAEAFLDLVRRAVREDWIARGVMRREGEAPSARALRRATSKLNETGEARDGSPETSTPSPSTH